MLPYYIPVVAITMLLFTQKYMVIVDKHRKIINFSFFLGVITLIVIAGIRGNGNGDYFVYRDRGADIKSLYDVFHNTIALDKGYCILALIVNKLHLPAQAVIAMMTLISLGCISITIKRYSTNSLLSLLVYLPFFYQFDMHAARTGVAISILTLSIPYIIDRKPLKFLVVLLMAMLFHPEAIIGVFLYFLPYIRLSSEKGILILILEAIFVKLVSIDKLVKIVCLALHLPTSYYRRFLGYAVNTTYGYPFKLYDPRLLICVLLFCLSSRLGRTRRTDLKFQIKNSGYSKKASCLNLNSNIMRNFLSNAMFVTAFFMIFFSDHTFMVYRFSAFYNVLSILAVPCIYQAVLNGESVGFRVGNRRTLLFLMITSYVMLAILFASIIHVEYKVFELIYWN